MVLLGKIMILQGVRHPISCLGVCYANDPKKGGYTTPVPALDLTTSLRGDSCARIVHDNEKADISKKNLQSSYSIFTILDNLHI